tara:strand:- start:889 stop:1551 length:663 start_codon:yes stop_codon:yes gene_type:complete
MGAFKDFFTKGTLFGIEPDIMAKDIPPATNIGGVRDQFLRNKAKQNKKKKTTKKKKDLFSNVKTTPAGVDTSKSSYQAAAKIGKAGKVGDVTAPSFGAAFKIARKQLGAGKTFQYKGKKYTTDYAEEKAKKDAEKRIKRPEKKDFKFNLPPYNTIGFFDEGGPANLKPVPAGKKGKGLRKLPKPVRNKMGYMSGGGVANGYGRAVMPGRGGKDPKSIKVT